MKRFLLSTVMLGAAAMFVGCGEETKVKETTTTPTGTDTKVISEKKTGDMKDGGAAPSAPAAAKP